MTPLSLPPLPLHLIFPSRPYGFDTAWSFLLREEPATLALMRDAVEGLASELDRARLIADASGFTSSEGDRVVAYPMAVWQAVFPAHGEED